LRECVALYDNIVALPDNSGRVITIQFVF
jgi:hypothetical protein